MTERENTPEPPRERRIWADLGPRVLSALVLAAITAVALYLGGIWFALLVGGVFAGAYREWEMMVAGSQPALPGWTLIVLVGVVALAYPFAGWSGSAIACGITLVAGLVLPGAHRGWRSVGIVYFSIAMLAVLMMRGDQQIGIVAGAFLAFTIWLTDSAAFFAGRQIGGIKLSPDISPSKTWSGALGGLAIGVLGGGILWAFFVPSPWWIGLLLAALLSVAGQLGDLAESAVKRHFRIKDSSDIIPGHGGLMDRLDSLAFAGIVLAVIGVIRGGAEATSAGFLIW